jgi:phage terminase large subunit
MMTSQQTNEVKISLFDLIGAGYTNFWRTRKRYRVLKGGRASKKSCNTAHSFISNIMAYPLSNALCIRNTFNTHKDSTFAQLKWAARRQGVFELWKFTTNPLEAVYIPTGQKIIFRGLDDPLKLTSITVDVGVLCWVWIEEAYEIENESDFDLIDESIRGEMPEGLWKQLTLTYNPWINTHWTKTRFFDNQDPNAFTLTTTYKCNEWLDDADRKKIEDLQYTNPERFKVVGLGDYGLPGGAFFEEWRSDIHVVQPFEIPRWWKRFIAFDYGFDMLAVGFFAVDPGGTLFIYKEIYESGLTLTKAAKKIQEFILPGEEINYIVASPDLWNRNKDTGVPEIETMIKAGLKKVRQADNRRIPGWRNLREYITVIETPDNNGEVRKTARLLVFKNCLNVIRTLPAIVCDEKDPEDVSDEPHELTHMPEAIRYGCMSRPAVSVFNESELDKLKRMYPVNSAEYQIHSRYLHDEKDTVNMEELGL